MVYYLNPVNGGIDSVSSLGDGTSFSISWFRAFPSNYSNKVAYHIYYSDNKENIFKEGVKYISINDAIDCNLIGFEPGQEYWFAVRATEYNPTNYDLSNLPNAYDDLKYYPTSILAFDLGMNDLVIKLLNTSEFPSSGIIKIGAEVIEYSSIDNSNNYLLLNSISQRGMNSTEPRNHFISGFDGYHTYSPNVGIFIPVENKMYDRIYACQSRFEYPNFPFTQIDGYRQVEKDLLNTDLSVSDEFNEDFPYYDYSGWHRTDPVLLFNGTCVGSYIGGERGCIDGYGNFNRVRGLDLQEQNNQREEQLLELTGKPVVLMRRQMTGITCSCYLLNSEYPDDRCPYCLGTKFVSKWVQYFNPRRSDGKILVRPEPTDETLKTYEAGLESEYNLRMWTLTFPTIKTKDVIIMFDQAGNEEFRYEVLSVTRNSTILGLQGAQKLNTARIRKFDPAYQALAFEDTATMPEWKNTSIGFAIGSVAPHMHQIRRNENDPSTWEQMTQVSQGHTHSVYVDQNGQLKISETLGHSHELI